MVPWLHVGREVAACVLTVGVLEAWVEVLMGVEGVEAWRGRGGGGVSVDRRLGEVRGARYRGECNLISPLLSVLFLSVSYLCPFSRNLLFPSVFSSYTVQARYSVSVYVRPVCINALFVPEPFLLTLI